MANLAYMHACTRGGWGPRRTSRRRFGFTSRQRKQASSWLRWKWHACMSAEWMSQPTLRWRGSGTQRQRRREPAWRLRGVARGQGVQPEAFLRAFLAGYCGAPQGAGGAMPAAWGGG